MIELVNSTCIVLTGLPGSGKSFLKKKILDNFSNFETLIPITTRAPRENEIDGKDKMFVSDVYSVQPNPFARINCTTFTI